MNINNMNDMNNIFNVHIPDPDHMTCECGARIKRTSLSGHRKTAKHLRWIEEHFAERIQKRLAEENLRISAENIRRQEEALRYYQQKKKEEDDRVSRRSLPSHIVDIVFTTKLKDIKGDEIEHIECGICYEPISRETVFFTKCGHMMCRCCEKKLYDKKTSQCPECRREF